MGMTVPLLSSDMADFSGVFVRRSSEEPRHYSWHFPNTFAVTIIICLEIKCAVEGRGRHGRDRAPITSSSVSRMLDHAAHMCRVACQVGSITALSRNRVVSS